jgi:hypothetical protein
MQQKQYKPTGNVPPRYPKESRQGEGQAMYGQRHAALQENGRPVYSQVFVLRVTQPTDMGHTCPPNLHRKISDSQNPPTEEGTTNAYRYRVVGHPAPPR